MVAVVQLAIASGATFGGILFDASGYRATFSMSVAVLVVASGIAWLAARAARAEQGAHLTLEPADDQA